MSSGDRGKDSAAIERVFSPFFPYHRGLMGFDAPKQNYILVGTHNSISISSNLWIRPHQSPLVLRFSIISRDQIT